MKKDIVFKFFLSEGKNIEKNTKQVEAELCQAQEKLGLVNCGCLPVTLKLRSSSIYLKI